MTANGQPFFWFGDTAWALFRRLTREEAKQYLQDRKSKRFNAIQAVILGRRLRVDLQSQWAHYSRPNELARVRGMIGC